jgi:hypothetical protein
MDGTGAKATPIVHPGGSREASARYPSHDPTALLAPGSTSVAQMAPDVELNAGSKIWPALCPGAGTTPARCLERVDRTSQCSDNLVGDVEHDGVVALAARHHRLA